MITNQTIDGVPRGLLENFASYAEGSASGEVQQWVKKLRALLDAPANPLGDPVGSFDKHMQYMHENIELKKRISDLEAAQPRGVPVAWMFKYLSHSDSPPYRSFEVTDFHQNPKAPGIAEHTPLYAEQPAPVALTLPEFEPAFEAWWVSDGQYCRAGGGSYEKTFAYRAYEAALADVTRLTATARIPERLVMTDGLHTYEYVTGHNAAIDKMLGVKS